MHKIFANTVFMLILLLCFRKQGAKVVKIFQTKLNIRIYK